jgi:hypothetical protein
MIIHEDKIDDHQIRCDADALAKVEKFAREYLDVTPREVALALNILSVRAQELLSVGALVGNLRCVGDDLYAWSRRKKPRAKPKSMQPWDVPFIEFARKLGR